MKITRLRPPFPPAGNVASSGTPSAHAVRAPDIDARVDEAVDLMQVGRWREAFLRLAVAADAGNRVAARMALVFVRRGTSLFGGVYHATSDQRRRWQRASGEPE